VRRRYEEKNRKIKLSELLSEIMDIDPKQDSLIEGLCLDSRKLKKGELFLACAGEELDGRDFISDAINKGASTVLVEDELTGVRPCHLREGGDSDKKSDPVVPIIVVPNLRWKLGLIAAKFYDYPARKLTMISVTGTTEQTYWHDLLTLPGSYPTLPPT